MEIGYIRTPLGRSKIFRFGSGPREILIISGIHGNEHNSIATTRRLVVYLSKTHKNMFEGRITIIPVANPNAFKYKQRTSIIDGHDLNRVFPGDAERSATYRHAAAIWEIAQSVDYIVDLHTCGYCQPYILTLYKEYPEVKKFVEDLPPENMVESIGLQGQLFVEALKIGIKAAIIELPQDGLKLNDEIISSMSRKLLQSLINIEFLIGEKTKYNHKYFGTLVRHHADSSGIFTPKAKLGGYVGKGELLGRIGKILIKAKSGGKIISIIPKMFIIAGELVASIAPPVYPKEEHK